MRMDGWVDGWLFSIRCPPTDHVIVMVMEHHGSVPLVECQQIRKCAHFAHTLCIYAYQQRGLARSCMNKHVTNQTCSASTLNTYALQSMHARTVLY